MTRTTHLAETNPYTPSSPAHSAYKDAYDLSTNDEAYKVMCGRVLGYLLKEVPSNVGQLDVAKATNDCTDETKLIDLGTFYIERFIRTCE